MKNVIGTWKSLDERFYLTVSDDDGYIELIDAKSMRVITQFDLDKNIDLDELDNDPGAEDFGVAPIEENISYKCGKKRVREATGNDIYEYIKVNYHGSAELNSCTSVEEIANWMFNSNVLDNMNGVTRDESVYDAAKWLFSDLGKKRVREGIISSKDGNKTFEELYGSSIETNEEDDLNASLYAHCFESIAKKGKRLKESEGDKYDKSYWSVIDTLPFENLEDVHDIDDDLKDYLLDKYDYFNPEFAKDRYSNIVLKVDGDNDQEDADEVAAKFPELISRAITSGCYTIFEKAEKNLPSTISLHAGTLYSVTSTSAELYPDSDGWDDRSDMIDELEALESNSNDPWGDDINEELEKYGLMLDDSKDHNVHDINSDEPYITLNLTKSSK